MSGIQWCVYAGAFKASERLVINSFILLDVLVQTTATANFSPVCEDGF